MMQRRLRRQYTPEFRAGAVKMVLEEGKSMAQVAKDLDLTRSALENWVRQAKADAGQGPSGALASSEKEELARLRRESPQLRMEREILKNASGRWPHRLLRQKLGRAYRGLRRVERPFAIWCSPEPVKKHGPGRVADLRVVMPVGQSRLGN